MFCKNAWEVFNQSIIDYHKIDSVVCPINNPYSKEDIQHLLYQKNWIDTVQWHLEDIIRDPNIDPVEALRIKREIDASNQRRTDLVEFIDAYFLDLYKEVNPLPNATLNTETPAWAIDRYSILALKIFHMKEETLRADATMEHKQKCQEKLDVLLSQHQDLTLAIEELLEDLQSGKKYMKTYKQMKMYNDTDTNPVLRAAQK
ncbi:MAG: hypothetical protein C4K58_00175 [Flavobacteriaceae bacterium]|nr:MAG: hypothetical protein C4K58_00175 [Flavobacteriaceae bacterium]